MFSRVYGHPVRAARFTRTAGTHRRGVNERRDLRSNGLGALLSAYYSGFAAGDLIASLDRAPRRKAIPPRASNLFACRPTKFMTDLRTQNSLCLGISICAVLS